MSSRGWATIALVLACFVGAMAAACGPPEPPVEPRFADVAAINKSKCGRCHELRRRWSMSRAEVDGALVKHRARVPLTEDQWSLMAEFLAKP